VTRHINTTYKRLSACEDCEDNAPPKFMGSATPASGKDSSEATYALAVLWLPQIDNAHGWESYPVFPPKDDDEPAERRRLGF
jgi:hypothetical protein